MAYQHMYTCSATHTGHAHLTGSAHSIQSRTTVCGDGELRGGDPRSGGQLEPGPSPLAGERVEHAAPGILCSKGETTSCYGMLGHKPLVCFC